MYRSMLASLKLSLGSEWHRHTRKKYLRVLPNGNRTNNLAVSTSNALLLSYSRLVKIIKRLNDILTSLSYFLFLLTDYLSIFTFFSEAIVVWSSWESFKAVWTFEAFATISAFNSRHFCIKRFSLSWDFFNALCNFSYSTRNFSRLLSPMSSPRTYKHER